MCASVAMRGFRAVLNDGCFPQRSSAAGAPLLLWSSSALCQVLCAEKASESARGCTAHPRSVCGDRKKAHGAVRSQIVSFCVAWHSSVAMVCELIDNSLTAVIANHEVNTARDPVIRLYCLDKVKQNEA